jgi:pSer/pThr/pTyr-binding forkhead associated (FHA) protein
MTRITPRATPVVPAPGRSVVPRASEPALSYLLRAPVVVVAPDGERELHRGVLTVGRLYSSDIALEDPLVSRVHARVVALDDGSVAVEDLHSTNGVFVNGVRITRGLRQLHDGDRLLIGTTELSLFAVRARASNLPTLRAPVPTQAPPLAPAASIPRPEMPATDRADALEVIGRLAKRLADGGNVAEAVRVLSTHLNKVLLGATAGLSVPDQVLDGASHFAVELFRWTDNVAWIDYVIELYVAIARVPTEKSLTAIEPALKVPNLEFDRELLAHFVERLTSQADALSPEDLWRLRRLQRVTSAAR